MSKNDRPKPRLAPAAAAVAATQQDAVARLQALDSWTEIPSNLPAPAAAVAPPAAAAPVQPVLPQETPAPVVVDPVENPEPARVVSETPAAAPVAAPQAVETPVQPDTPAESPEALAARFTPPPPPPPPAERPQRPWEIPGPKETHPYHTIMSERLFQKIDYAWKRSGNRSAKEFVLNALEKAADQALRDLGIEP